jgi:phosphate:Na+ symporter
MQQLITMIGGACLFLYGLHLTKEGLQQSGSGRWRNIIARMTQTRFSSLLLGTAMTSVLQSSTATTVMLVGFANVGMIHLNSALCVALGAGIGTSIFSLLLAQVLSLSAVELSFMILAIGFVLVKMGRGPSQILGKILMGFGFILYGTTLVAQTRGL